MEWYAKSTRRMRDPDYLRLPADLRGHHDALLALLADRERGPVLHGARLWNRRDWDLAIRATQGSIQRLCIAGLAEWHGDDLHVTGYDVEGETRMARARENGRAGAKSRWSGAGDPNGGGNGDPSSGPNGVGNGDPNRVNDARDETRRDETNEHIPRPGSGVLELPVPRTTRLAFDLEAIYALYPRKVGKKNGLHRLSKAIKTQGDYELVLAAVKNYAAQIGATQTAERYVKHFDTWVGEWEDWAPGPDGKPANGATPATPTFTTGMESEADRMARAFERDAIRMGLVDAEGNPT